MRSPMQRLNPFLILILLMLPCQFCAAMDPEQDPHLSQAATAYVLGNFDQAFKEFEISAQKGNSIAQFWLSEMYFQGKGVPQNYQEAARWCRSSAEQGDDLAK